MACVSVPILTAVFWVGPTSRPWTTAILDQQASLAHSQLPALGLSPGPWPPHVRSRLTPARPCPPRNSVHLRQLLAMAGPVSASSAPAALAPPCTPAALVALGLERVPATLEPWNRVAERTCSQCDTCLGQMQSVLVALTGA